MADSKNPFYTGADAANNPFALGGGGGGSGGSRNPFETGHDRQAGSFGSYNPYGGAAGGGGGPPSVQQQVQASQDRQIETQRRALQSMYHSEQMGVDTAQELVRQGEVLNRTEEKLDHIEAVQKESQRHINSLSSMFGGIKNWWHRGDSVKKQQQQPQQSRYEPPGQSLNTAMASSSSAQSRIQARTEPQGGLGSASTGAAGYQQQQKQAAGPQTAYDRAFSENLGEMETGMGRLKQLALGLGGEIDRQNVQLERMSGKTDKTNAKMDEQNSQMNKILYGSKAPPPDKK